MNQLQTTEPKVSLIAAMAAKRGMDAVEFQKVVRAICMPSQHTNEQFGAYLLVADKYKLDPLLKEIYAFPAKGGGIVPIVSIDGWVNLINTHGAFDGMEFDVEHDSDGKLVSCTCIMYRKDRARPISVKEYLSECKRNTEPWKMEHRMLRHKAMIQCARYAFGFAGIYDEDEGERIAEMKDVSPGVGDHIVPPVPPKPSDTGQAPPAPPSAQRESAISGPVETVSGAATISGDTSLATSADEITDIDPETGEVIDDGSPADFFYELETALMAATSIAGIAIAWDKSGVDEKFSSSPGDMDTALAIKARAVKKVKEAASQ